jgi:hypothetical protein
MSGVVVLLLLVLMEVVFNPISQLYKFSMTSIVQVWQAFIL